MPYLGDYLGQLLSEITIARMQADLESVRIAELYAMHPLLATMPVPHVRLPDVELDIPVLIKESEEPRAGQSARGGVAPEEMSKKFDEVLAAQLKKAGIEMPVTGQRKIRAVLNERIAKLSAPSETAVDVNRVADDLTSAVLGIIDEQRAKTKSVLLKTGEQFNTELKDAARLAFLQMRVTPPRLFVLVTNTEIREAGPSENLTKLHLKITEQGLEWTTVENEGLVRNRLVPE